MIFGSLSGFPSNSSARTFFSFSSPNDFGRFSIALSPRHSSASSAHFPRFPGTRSIAFFFALSVTKRDLDATSRSSSVVSSLSSSTSVTSSLHAASALTLVNLLCPSLKISRHAQSLSEEGTLVNALRSASKTFSRLSSPIDSGSDVSALSLRMSVIRPLRREISLGNVVSAAPSEIFSVFTLVACHSAGSTATPAGRILPGPPVADRASNASSFRFPAIAFSTSGHVGFGRDATAASAASAASFASASFLVAASVFAASSSLPPAPLRSFASSSRFFRFDRCVDVSPSGASGSCSFASSSSVSSSSLSPPRSILAASSA